VGLSTELYFSDTDNIARFKNTTLINLINLLCILLFSNSTMLSMALKNYSVNECIQEMSKSMKLHILGVWQNTREIY